MAVAAQHRVPRVQPLPKLPVEAGEHDDFAREIAIAPPRAAIHRHAWLGVIGLVVLALCAFAFCVLVPASWVPISNDHVLPAK